MKKLLSLSAALLTACLSFAQNADLTQFVNDHKSDPGMTFAYLSKDMFEVVSKSEIKDQDWKKVQNVVKNIGSLTILVSDSLETSLALYKEAKRIIPTDELDELLTVRDGKENVHIWTKDDDKTITDLILLVGSPDDFVLISFTGALELGNITDLISLFDAKEATELANTSNALSAEFSINPNPTSGDITLIYNDAQDTPDMLTVTDQNGRLVKTLQLSNSPNQQVNLNGVPSGLYWVQLKTTKGKVGVKQVQVIDRP